MLADAAPGAAFGFGFADALDVFGGVLALAVLVCAFAFGPAFALAGALPGVAFGFGPRFTLGVLRGTLAVSGRTCGPLADLNVTTAGALAAVCPVNAGGNDTGADWMTGFGSATGAGASSTRRSGTSTRRSCQGKAKPGIPNSCPPKIRLNSRAWNSRESSSEMLNRLPWWRARRTRRCKPAAAEMAEAGNGSYHEFRAVSAATEFKRDPPSGLGHHGGRGATWPPAPSTGKHELHAFHSCPPEVRVDGRGLAWGAEAWQRFIRHRSP